MAEEKKVPVFDAAEVQRVEEFFASSLGKKVLLALDNEAQEKNNLLQRVNLSSGVFKPEETGIRCQMAAAEVRTILEIVERLKAFGDYHAYED